MKCSSVVLLNLVFSILLCSAHQDVRYSSTDACESDHTCEYVYSLEMDQFTVYGDQPMTITATVQITCESSGSYGSVDATRYCMTVTDFGGNYLNFGRNETNEAETDQSPMQIYAVNYLSGWFCFVQTSEGQILAVYHSQTEDNEAVNFKKGIAAAFQANFKGTAEETEIDPGSKHLSHYSYVNSEDGGTIKMHRSISNNDVVEYAINVPDEDVELTEEEDIEYKDGRLVKSNGTMNISMEKALSSQEEFTPDDIDQDNNFSNIFNARGSFVMELKVCRLVPLTARGRRNAVRKHFNSDSTSEESLMASFDQAKIDRERLADLRKHLQTEEHVIVAIQNINSSKIYKILAQTVVLERKYGANGISVMEYVLHYLNEITDKESEDYVYQRLSIYSLLSTESSVQAQNVLIERLQSSDMSDLERTSLILAIATLPDPSSELIQTLEHMITQSDDTTTLLLAYGALVVNVAPDKELEMVSFLVDRIPDGTDNNHVLIHILHALGNTQSLLAVQYIVMYTQHDDEAVRLTAVTALRLFTGIPSVQQQLLYTLGNFTQSVSLISTIIDALRDGYNHNKEMSVNQDLIQLLAWNSLNLGNFDLQTELIEFLHVLGTPESLSLADRIGTRGMTSRNKRAYYTYDWDSTYPSYNAICPLYDRQQDVINFPYHSSFLWTKRVGRTSGSYQIYLEAVAGAFAGYNSNCEFKLKAKCVVRGHAFGHEEEVVQVLGRLVLQNGKINTKVYAKFGTSIVIDIDETISLSFEIIHPLPTYKKTLFSFSFTYIFWSVPVTLDANFVVGIGGLVKLTGSLDGELKGAASVIQTAIASVDASVCVSVLIARAGLTLTGSCQYNIYADLSATIDHSDACAPVTIVEDETSGSTSGEEEDETSGSTSGEVDETRGGLSIGVYDEWPGISITLSVFLQIPWDDPLNWDIFTTTLFSSGGRRLLYSYAIP